MTITPDTPVFYTLPAHRLTEGLSTDDGQDVISVTSHDDIVMAEVYTPRSDDRTLDEENRLDSEMRVYGTYDEVDLAVFVDTRLDGRGPAD